MRDHAMKASLALVAGVAFAMMAPSCKRAPHLDRSQYPTVPESQLQGVVRTSLDHPEPTPAQIERRRRSVQQLKMMGLPFLEKLPVIEDDSQVKPRDAKEVARRCIAITLCGIKGETNGDDALVAVLTRKYGTDASFTPKETAFINDKHPTGQQLVDYSWQYECVHVLLWALGHVDKLAPPNEPCDAAHEVKALLDRDPRALVDKAKLRPMTDILDMADLYYHLDWAAVELRMTERTSDRIDESIIQERHRALNWLIGYMNQEWDDVTTDT